MRSYKISSLALLTAGIWNIIIQTLLGGAYYAGLGIYAENIALIISITYIGLSILSWLRILVALKLAGALSSIIIIAQLLLSFLVGAFVPLDMITTVLHFLIIYAVVKGHAEIVKERTGGHSPLDLPVFG